MSTPPPSPRSIPPHLRSVTVPRSVGGSAARPAATYQRPSGFAEKVRVTIRGVGEILITLGLVLLLFCAYQLWWTDVTSTRANDKVLATLNQEFAAAPAPEVGGKVPPLGPLTPGEPFARMYVPRFGSSWVRPIVQGVNLEDLHKGVGHYPNSALPGEIGNFAVAGHRTTNGHPFRNIDKLQVGDQVFVETKDAWYTYQITQTRLTVDPRGGYYVVGPVPVKGSTAAPTQRLMTMTSCNPPYSASQRMVAHAVLVDTRSRTLGPPKGVPAGVT